MKRKTILLQTREKSCQWHFGSGESYGYEACEVIGE